MEPKSAVYRTRRASVPGVGTEPERALETQLIQAGVTGYVKQHKFHPTRRFRFDYAWVDAMLAVECEGGTWARRRTGHTTGAGYAANCLKYAEGVILGWRILRFTTDQIDDGTALRYILAALNISEF